MAQNNIKLKVEDFAIILNTDKMLIKTIDEICFRRCILSYENEYLNQLE